jgi:hypothetical protein
MTELASPTRPRRPVLVGGQARRTGLVLVHRLVQHHRLIAVVTSVDYAAATFASALFNLWGLDLGVITFADGASLDEIFTVFVVILILHALINILSAHLAEPAPR